MEKPKCKLEGQDGNIFNLLGLANRALRKAGQTDEAKRMYTEAMDTASYDEALQTIMKYVDAE